MLFLETPFNWDLIPYCRGHGIKTCLVTMYECTPIMHPEPDLYICPSLLDLQYFHGSSKVFLPLPVEYPWKQKIKVEEYIHNGGYLGLRGREGTVLLIEAMEHVKSPIKLTIRVQENVAPAYQRKMAADRRITYIAATVPYEELYSSGDACVAPQKFNGCSLPLQEARASGMLVMTTDRFPMSTWLPRTPLIPVRGYQKARIGGAYMEFDEALVDPRDIARKIDEWYQQDITEYSLSGKRWAEENSWEVLKPRYLDALA